jgi:hypothetical protein
VTSSSAAHAGSISKVSNKINTPRDFRLAG